MNVDDERKFFGGVEVVGIEEPALHFVAVSFPGDVFGFAPGGFEGGVDGR